MSQGWGHRVDCGDVDKCFESGECDHIIEGTCKMGGQEHFYLEPHGSIVIPSENDEIKIIASTQVLSCALLHYCCKGFNRILKPKAPHAGMFPIAAAIHVCKNLSATYLVSLSVCTSFYYCDRCITALTQNPPLLTDLMLYSMLASIMGAHGQKPGHRSFSF